MMSEQKVPRSVEQRIVIKFLVGELPDRTEQVLTRAGGRVEVVASLS